MVSGWGLRGKAKFCGSVPLESLCGNYGERNRRVFKDKCFFYLAFL